MYPIAKEFDMYLGSSAAEIPVKFQSDTIIITSNLAASILHEIWHKASYRLMNRGPDVQFTAIHCKYIEIWNNMW